MEQRYFDLTDESNNLADLSINKINDFDCQLIDKNNIHYDGFLLAKSEAGEIFTNCDFQKSAIDQKYQARLTFRKTDSEFKDRNVNKGSDCVRISFLKGQDGYREFWKMISFLYQWRETIDLGEFKDYFSITDKSLADALPKIASIDNKYIVLESLKKLSKEDLENFGDLVNVTKVKNILEIWRNNKQNYIEEFWQKTFQDNAWILSQIFASPFIKVGQKFYCGGKDDDDKGGVEGDLLYASSTKNLAFIEIKTPKKDLILGKEYRGTDEGKENRIYSLSEHITGAVNQVLNQKKVYLKTHQEKNDRLLNSPRCIVLMGILPDEEDGCKSFDLYRHSLRDVEVITYDELFTRIESILKIFDL